MIGPGDAPLTLRVTATDDGDHWAWRDPQGNLHRRRKDWGALPLIVTEVTHGRPYNNTRDQTRGIVLVEPTKEN